ncbi:hypothetical protein SLE2022_345450 [Rubroshorea leprosula]
MCSATSPRISFSHDMNEDSIVPIEHGESRRDTMLLDSNSDFEFIICSSFDRESSSADELFANGMILPAVGAQPSKQVQKCKIPPLVSLSPPFADPSEVEHSRKESMRETVAINSENLEEKPQPKSFWGFKRSSSLNCDIKRSLICSLPLLSRSNSTGSVPNPKRGPIKDAQRQSLQRQSSSSSTYLKPPLKKNQGSSYNNGIRISPVLNVPPPYISKGTANLFGFASLLRNGKNKNKK